MNFYRRLVTALVLAPLAFLASAQENGSLRLAWQPIGTIQGHIGAVFQHTNVLALNGIRADMTPFMTGGAPINEGLASGQFDVASYGMGPVIAALSRGVPVKLVAIVNYFKAGMLVNAKSPFTTVAGLKGKKVALAFGSGVHRTGIEMLRAAGLEPGRDVELINLNPADAATALKTGEIDAWVMWDPSYTDAIQKGLGRSVAVTDPQAQFNASVMSSKFIADQPATAVAFLAAEESAVWYMSSHKQETSEWMRKLVPISLEAILESSNYDRNWNAKSALDVDLSFHERDLITMQKEAQFLYDNKFVPKLVNMRDHIDTAVYQRSKLELQKNAAKVATITALK